VFASRIHPAFVTDRMIREICESIVSDHVCGRKKWKMAEMMSASGVYLHPGCHFSPLEESSCSLNARVSSATGNNNLLKGT
jgi:hypothetical protein